MNQFSIILPVRNGGEYVKECVNSILSQTYPNFNLIVLDNCSSDGTKQWIEGLMNDKIIIHPSNKSLTIEENWARIKDVEKNEFITLIGHDDLLSEDFLQTINDLIKEFPDASLYHTHFNYIDSDGNLIKECKRLPTKIVNDKFIELFLTNKMDSMGTGYVMRSTDYNSKGGIPTNYPALLFADFQLWLELIEISYEVVSPKNCFAFRIHQSTTTTSGNTKFLEAFEKFIYYLQTKKSNDKMKYTIENKALDFIQFYCQGLTHRLIKTPTARRTKDENVKMILKKCKAYSNLLVPENNFNPQRSFSVKLAILIDSNILTRRLFLLLKQIFNKPILK